MSDNKINYESYLQDYKKMLFGSDNFDSKKNKNRIRIFYYKLMLKNLIHLIKSIYRSFPSLIRIVINSTREMGISIFLDYIGINFYIVDRMRQKELIIKRGKR